MSKKRKKKQEPIATEKKPTRATNLKVITRIECLRDNSVLTQQTCQACEFHDNRYCTYNKPKKLIKTLGIGSPMRFNRNFFQMSSDNLREASLNYYIATDIMNDVRSIEGYPNYRKLKTSLLSGEFKQDDKEPKPTPSIKGRILSAYIT